MEFLKETHQYAKAASIAPYRYKKVARIQNIESAEAEYAGENRYSGGGEWQPFEVGGTWQANDTRSRFFRADVTIPADFTDGPVVLEIKTGGEALLKLDGKIKCAIENTRSRVWLGDGAKPGRKYEMLIEAGINGAGYAGSRATKPFMEYALSRADVCVVDTETEAIYFDFMLAWEILQASDGNYFRSVRRFFPDVPREYYQLVKDLQSDPTTHGKMLSAIVSALKLLDFENGDEAARISIKAAGAKLRSFMKKVNHASPVTIALTGASHIDVAWLWTLDETIRKCARTFSNTLDLMERYPEHIFTQSQPKLYAYTKEHYPEVYEGIKSRVAEGRWELAGNSWVECDTNVPSGEALVRQFLYGRKFFLDEFGKCSNIFWMPDVFGYSWAIPQIMKRSGMDYFITTKLICNDTNTFPYTYFNWQGVDGTRVFSHLSRENYNGYPEPWYAHYLWEHNPQKGDFDQVIMTYGYGDGGGGPTYEMLENARRINDFPGMYNFEYKPARQFFDEVSATDADLPVWNDEMYFEMHRGTYTTQSRTKRNNRKCELLYRQAEFAANTAEIMLGAPYDKNSLDCGWDIILTNQFHDILPGSSINPVYSVCERDYAKATEHGRGVEAAALSAIAAAAAKKGERSIVVFNFLSWERDDFATVSVPESVEDLRTMSLVSPDGTAVPFNISEKDGDVSISFSAKSLPATGCRAYTLAKTQAAAESGITARNDLLENVYFKLTFDPNGGLTSVYDKLRNTELLTSKGNILRLFQDNANAWDIQIDYMEKWYDVTDVRVTGVKCENGRAVLSLEAHFNKSFFTQDIIIYDNIHRIDFVTKANWQERNLLLKAVFPVGISAKDASYEIAYGTIQRPTHQNTSWDKAKFEVPAHKWADLSDTGMGVSILNDCKYGYDIHESEIRISLLRGTSSPDHLADLGNHEFTYSLYAHDGGWSAGECVAAGYELNVPAACVYVADGGAALPSELSFFGCDCKNLVLDAFKKAEDGDGYILRMYESGNRRTNAHIKTVFPVKTVTETNLMEQNETPVALADGGFDVSARPFEIKTFRLTI